MTNMYVLFSFLFVYAFASGKPVDPTSFYIKGEVLNYPDRQVALEYLDNSGRKTITAKTDEHGRFSFIIEKLPAPFSARMYFLNNNLRTGVYIAPGYQLTFTADAKDQFSFMSGKALQGVGAESNRFIFLLDSLKVRRATGGSWNEMDTRHLLAFINENRRLRDSLFHAVYDRQPIQDPWLGYFAKVTALDNEFSQMVYLVSHAADNKQMTWSQMMSFVREHSNPAILDDLYKEEYMVSEEFLLLMLNDYPFYLRALDCRRSPDACDAKKFNIELVNKITTEYKGPIRDKAMIVKIRNAIVNCRTYEEWMLYKNAFLPHLNTLSSREAAASLDTLLSTMGSRLAKTAVGKPAPSFAAIDSTGKAYALEDFKGRVVYIDLWASWCGPCRELTPFMKKLYNKLKKDKRIVCMSIAVQDKQGAWKTALKQEKTTWLQLFDNNGMVQKAYVANSIPKFILIDKQGNIVNLDAPMPDDPVIEALLKKEIEK
jgi:thiol-disulfide isomerase/thioredoxin